MCLENDACYGVNFQKQGGLCEINTPSPDGQEEAMDSNPSWTAYLRLNGKCYTYLDMFYTNDKNVMFSSLTSKERKSFFFHFFIQRPSVYHFTKTKWLAKIAEKTMIIISEVIVMAYV
jgi:hypothetical protein